MPFELLPTVSSSNKPSLVSISYRKLDTKNGRSNSPKLIIAVPPAIMNGFKEKPGVLYELSVGTGVDLGKARIVPSGGKNGIPVTHFKYGLVFRFGFVPMLGQDQAEKEFVAGKMIGTDSFEIELPPWFKSDEESV